MRDKILEAIVFILFTAILVGVFALLFASDWELYSQFIRGLNQEPNVLGFIGWMMSR